MNLYIYCAGGFGKEVMEIARRKNSRSNEWNDIKFVDDSLAVNVKYSAEVLSFDQMILNGGLDQAEFLIANGEPAVRSQIREKIKGADVKLGRLIDVSAVVADTARISDGVIVAPLCSISSDAVLKHNSSVNTMSIIAHDVLIGENSVISSMVNLGGNCKVGENSYIGMGALIKEGIEIGSNAIVGMGSVVYNDIPDGVIALGNPARVIRNNTERKVFK